MPKRKRTPKPLFKEIKKEPEELDFKGEWITRGKLLAIVKGKTQLINGQIGWGGTIEKFPMFQQWNANGLHVDNKDYDLMEKSRPGLKYQYRKDS